MFSKACFSIILTTGCKCTNYVAFCSCVWNTELATVTAPPTFKCSSVEHWMRQAPIGVQVTYQWMNQIAWIMWSLFSDWIKMNAFHTYVRPISTASCELVLPEALIIYLQREVDSYKESRLTRLTLQMPSSIIIPSRFHKASWNKMLAVWKCWAVCIIKKKTNISLNTRRLFFLLFCCFVKMRSNGLPLSTCKWTLFLLTLMCRL